MTKEFTIALDGSDWIVLSKESRARSFALIPTDHNWCFATKAEAAEQAKALSGQSIQTRMYDTPDRFEAVADVIYGPAW